jgi:hypothetical protein
VKRTRHARHIVGHIPDRIGESVRLVTGSDTAADPHAPFSAAAAELTEDLGVIL